MDTINLILTKEQAPKIDFLNELPKHLSQITFSGISYGVPTIRGNLRGFTVSISDDKVRIGKASLTKYFLGNSFADMSRSSIEQAFAKMSDEIHLPISKGIVKEFHFAKNIMLNNEVGLYLPRLGNYGRYRRLEQPNGINYTITERVFSIYDKVKEAKFHRDIIPQLYQNSDVMRLEARYKKDIPTYFNRASITVADLYNESFYMEVVNDWYKHYSRIEKLKKIKIDMQNVKGKKELKEMGVLALIEMEGGKLQFLQNLLERYKKGDLTKKQYYDFKAMVEDCSTNKLLTIDDELMIELNEKVKEAVKFYN